VPREKAETILPKDDKHLRLLNKPPDWPLVLKTIQELIGAGQKA